MRPSSSFIVVVLPEPLGPSRSEDLAAADLEIEGLERHLLAAAPEVAVDLGEIAGLDDHVTAQETGISQ
jgi:hypothetical protein